MVIVELFMHYIVWHYSIAIRDIFSLWGDSLWFLWNYFSIRQLTKTFFTPFKRLGESAVNFFDFFNYFSAVIITLLMRVVGVVIRSAIILLGIISIILDLVIGLAFLIVWLIMPAVLTFLFAVGFELLIHKF